MYNKVIFLSCTLLLGFGNGYEISLKDKSNAHFLWKFSKGRQLIYFNSTKDISSNFLPTQINKLPERNGIWLIRHKDFLELPDVFTGNENLGNKASISYSANSMFFHSAKFTAFIHGDVSLNLMTNAGFGGEDRNKEISLGGNHFKQCIEANNFTMTSDPHWITYEINLLGDLGATKMELEIAISHPKSFLILDEITLTYYDDPSQPLVSKTVAEYDDNDSETYLWSKENLVFSPFDESHPKKNETYRIHCSVDK